MSDQPDAQNSTTHKTPNRPTTIHTALLNTISQQPAAAVLRLPDGPLISYGSETLYLRLKENIDLMLLGWGGGYLDVNGRRNSSMERIA